MPDIPNMEKYLERGRAVHQWTEQVDEGATVRPPSDYEGYCEAYKKFCHTFAPSWTHIEQPFDNGEWHGFIDRVGYIRGHDTLVIADLKTGAGKGKAAQTRIATQLASYAMGWKPEAFEKVMRVGIFLLSDGAWHTKVYDDRRDFDRWQQLLKEAIHGNQETSEEGRDTTEPDKRGNAGGSRSADVSDGVRTPLSRADDETHYHKPLQTN
tara:strand:+ start:108 stop:737 length:630 start_codon:yes stop_codon:yes gene_type:complete